MSVTTKVAYTVSNAATKTYSYSSIDLLDTNLATLSDQITVYLTPLSTGVTNELTLTTDFTFATLPTKEVTLVNDAATDLAVGDIITIARTTKNDELYTDFTGLSNLRSEDINNNSNQLLHIIQENITGVGDSLQKNTALTAWDGEGLPSENCSPAVSSTGWPTLAQVQSLIAGAEIATVQDGYLKKASGDSSTTAFGCPTFPKTDISADKLIVAIDGILQVPTTDYTYALNASNVPTVTFTTAPATGTNNIVIRTLRGAVQAMLDDDSIDGDAIVDGTLPIAKLEAAAGSADRFISFDANGDPSLGTLPHTQISDFDAGVYALKWTDMTAPTANYDMNGHQIFVATGTAPTSAVNKAQMEAAITAATGVAGSSAFMEPYDTDSSAEYTDAAGTTQTVTGLDSGTYIVFVSLQDTASPSSVTVNGITRAGQGFSQTIPFIVTVTGTITVTCGGTDRIRNLTGYRLA